MSIYTRFTVTRDQPHRPGDGRRARCAAHRDRAGRPAGRRRLRQRRPGLLPRPFRHHGRPRSVRRVAGGAHPVPPLGERADQAQQVTGGDDQRSAGQGSRCGQRVCPRNRHPVRQSGASRAGAVRGRVRRRARGRPLDPPAGHRWSRAGVRDPARWRGLRRGTRGAVRIRQPRRSRREVRRVR